MAAADAQGPGVHAVRSPFRPAAPGLASVAAGAAPCEPSLAAATALEDGEELVVLAPFEPVPLEGVLSSQGFSYEAEDLGGGDWRVTFRRPS